MTVLDGGGRGGGHESQLSGHASARLRMSAYIIISKPTVTSGVDYAEIIAISYENI